MAKSKTEICNLAVSWLGGRQITNVETDPGLEARLCRANYDPSRKAVLEEREWTFAIKRDSLTPLAESPKFGYSYKFLLPSDFLRLISVYDPGQSNRASPETIVHVKEENHIYADLETIDVKYIMDLKNTNRFSALFDQALAGHIAANIAISLTENASHQGRMVLMYEDKLNKAITSDSLQGSRERLQTSQLEKSRRMFVRPR